MLEGGRRCYKMPCESCAVQFSVFKRKRACSECERYYCSGCLRRGGGTMCAPCRVLSTRPLARQTISHLKVRDLQCFLQRQNVSTRGCVEKEELVTLCVSHVNSASYRRRGQRPGAGAFTAFKGITNNINDFLNSAFDLRNSHTQPPPDRQGNCFNAAHVHSPTAPPNNSSNTDRLFTTTPGGEADIRVPVPEQRARSGSAARSDSPPRVDTTDCFEIEDLDDSGWELVNRPADPLPNDSDVLLASTEGLRPPSTREAGGRSPGGASEGSGRSSPTLSQGSGPHLTEPDEDGVPRRAASEFELHRSESAATNTDTASLQDEPIMHHDHDTSTPKQVTLESLRSMSELERLSVKQLKELLLRNRVEFRGCLERRDLLDRARTLWRDHERHTQELDSLPLEECCKICMAAPLECVLLECGHIAACTACAKQLAECPICRQYVVRAVRCFRS